jgi:hypothetical protein
MNWLIFYLTQAARDSFSQPSSRLFVKRMQGSMTLLTLWLTSCCSLGASAASCHQPPAPFDFLLLSHTYLAFRAAPTWSSGEVIASYNEHAVGCLWSLIMLTAYSTI